MCARVATAVPAEIALTDLDETIEPKKRNGHGGVRKGAGRPRIEEPRPWDIEGVSRSTYYLRVGFGGPQPGSGRPRKIKLTSPPKPPEVVFRSYLPSRSKGSFYMSGPATRAAHNSISNTPKLVTFGCILTKPQAFVYVGVSRTGIVKIGMSSQPHVRCGGLGVGLVFTVPVVVASAKLVETYALQELSALRGDSEWVECSPEVAIDAVCVAWMAAARMAHVNPLVTADEARMARVRMAA